MILRYFPRSRSRCQSSKRTNEHASSICSCRRVFAAGVPFPQRRVSFPRGFALQEIILVPCYFRSFSFSRASIAVNSIFLRARNHFLVPAPRSAKNSVHWHAARPLSFWCIADLEFHQILLIVFSRKKEKERRRIAVARESSTDIKIPSAARMLHEDFYYATEMVRCS